MLAPSSRRYARLLASVAVLLLCGLRPADGQATFDIEWTPPLDTTPAVPGPPVLYAGANYTRFLLTSTEAVTANGRLVMVDPSIHYSAAAAGHCLSELYYVMDKLPPLDASIIMPGSGFVVDYDGGIIFTQGGTFKLCWSPGGTFDIADGFLIPEQTSEYIIYGATDTCDQGSGCLGARRFFCHVPHADYLIYGVLGTLCEIFMQTTNTPLVYSRLTWTEGSTTTAFADAEQDAGENDIPLRTIGAQCPGQEVGPGLEQSDQIWAREVDPLSRIDLGHVRVNLTSGFHYRICFCPAYDASTDGVCGELSDFAQQVGYLDGVMITFDSARGDSMGEVASQVIAMTRFTLRVDCGNGPWCSGHGLARVKVIAKSWDAIETDVDLPHWDDRNGCEDAIEVDAWHSPPNCIDPTTGERLSSHCLLSGGLDPSYQYFENIRMSPLLHSYTPVAQTFTVCFVHLPLEVDDINASEFNRTSDLAMQNDTRTWWKVGQLVVEPLLLRDTSNFFVQRPAEIRVSPLHENRTSTLHDDFPEFPADGLEGQGPILKVVEETKKPIDNARCASGLLADRALDGLECVNASFCMPRATKVDEQLVLNGGDPDHRVVFRKAGVFAVCYCEMWQDEEGACEDASHWMLVGKMLVAGPVGFQDWILDKGVIQSFTIDGFGFSDFDTLRDGGYGPMHTVRILAWGETDCNGESLNNLASGTLQVCSPDNFGRCQDHDNESAVGFGDVNISDIPGYIWRYNSVFPHASIYHLGPDGEGASIVKFSEVAVLTEGDTIHFEDNIMPHASHWRRQADLDFIIRGGDKGYKIAELMDAGREARIPLHLDPFPPLTIDPPTGGRWWRSNKLKIRNIKGLNVTGPHLVCWGFKYNEDDDAEYYMPAGNLTWELPSYLKRLDIGLTATAAGTTAPMMITFETGDNPLYTGAQNSMQLRVAFTNTSVIRPAESGLTGRPLEHLYEADQPHEAKQVVCGRIFTELYSEHEFGFPVPKGCWIDFNRYGALGRVQAIYMIFEPRNGLKALTTYTIVMNAELMHEVENYTGLSEDPGLIEVTALDDMYVKPEGVVDIEWANPDKLIVAGSRQGYSYLDGRFLDTDVARGGITIRQPAKDAFRYDDSELSDDLFLHVEGQEFGMSFLLKGDMVNPIRRKSIIRLYLWPLMLWSLDHTSSCSAQCIAQEGYVCSQDDVQCVYEATHAKCHDFIPPGFWEWVDSRNRPCEFYARPQACVTDGTEWTLDHGYTAVDSCCVCGGGVRSNSNVIKLTLPSTMDPARGDDVIHTIRFYRAGPVPERGFFATRWGAQLTDLNDEYPHYVTTAGRYIVKYPNETLYTPVATLVDAAGWGNEYMFKGEPLNDYYLRLQMPASLYTAPWDSNDLARVDIWLPAGFTCLRVVKVTPMFLDEDDEEMSELTVFPEDPPTGNGGLPESTLYEGGNLTTPGAGFRSGHWSFAYNKCTFELEKYMAIHDKQRLYLHIYVKNPTDALPRNDPRNFWIINLTSSGDFGQPEGHREVCVPYAPPVCNDTGETYYVNPTGRPLATRSVEKLFPDPEDIVSTIGPIEMGLPLNTTTEPGYTTSFGVLGIIEDFIVQPRDFRMGARNTLQIWFTPDSGCHVRDGFLGIQAPLGFDFGDPCAARDLPHTYYSIYTPPFGPNGAAPWSAVDPERVFPIEDMGECESKRSPRWSRGGVYVTVAVHGSLVSGRRYGLEIDVTNTEYYDFSQGFEYDAPWAFKLSIEDPEGYGLDGTKTTGGFFENNSFPEQAPEPPPLFYETTVEPIGIFIDEMQPYAVRPYFSRLEIDPVVLAINVTAALRITAPFGYEWSESFGDFMYEVEGSDPWPVAGDPEIHPDNRLAVVQWPVEAEFFAGKRYALAALLKVPSTPPLASSNAFYFEWGYNDTAAVREVGVRADAPRVRALRDFRIEFTNTNSLQDSRAFVWVELVSPVSENGTLEIELPLTYGGMIWSNTSLDGDAPYVDLQTVVEYGSDELPEDILCRKVGFAGGSQRLVLFSNGTGIEAGRYVLEFNVTNPATLALNSENLESPCGSEDCLSVHTKDLCGTARPITECDIEPLFHEVDEETGLWTSLSPAVLEPRWRWELDLWAAAAAPSITRPFAVGEILELPLDEKIYVGQDDRPKRRSAVVIAMAMSEFRPVNPETLYVRAPIGWEFDSICEFWTEGEDIFPPPMTGLPQEFTTIDGTLRLVSPWPSGVSVLSCRGFEHIAEVKLTGGLRPQNLYMFKISIKRNPFDTPWRRNTWSLTIGPESTGEMKGFRVATFPFAFLDPIYLAWTDKFDPIGTPVGITFNITTNLTMVELHGKEMYPLLRIEMAPLFEVVVDAESQDIQGGDCFVVLQMEGDCRLCGVPFHPDSYKCKREWNRKNVAEITLLNEDGWLYRDQMYKIWITVYNPHIKSAEDVDPRPWVMESFLGEPVPPSSAPDGYYLDYAEVKGFKISDRCELTVEVPLERNGSVVVKPHETTMRFPTMLVPGDVIELRAPPGFMLQIEEPQIRTLQEEWPCRKFEFLPVLWPTEEEIAAAAEEGDDSLYRPPERPPIPPNLPPWARPQVWVRSLPLSPPPPPENASQVLAALVAECREEWAANVSNTSANGTESPCDALLLPESYNVTEDLTNEGIALWVYQATLAAHNEVLELNETSNWTTEEPWMEPVGFLVLKDHCIDDPDNITDDGPPWYVVPRDANITASLRPAFFINESVYVDFEDMEKYYPDWDWNASADEVENVTEVLRLCVSAVWIDPDMVASTMQDELECRLACPEIVTCLDLPDGNFTCTTSENQTCVEQCDFEVPVNTTRRCAEITDDMPTNASIVDAEVSRRGACFGACCASPVEPSGAWSFSDWATKPPSAAQAAASSLSFLGVDEGQEDQQDSTTSSTTMPPDSCSSCSDGLVLLATVLWRTTSNLNDELEHWRAEYDAAITLRRWDVYPLQAEPMCEDNKMYFRLTEENMHPERELLNGTVLRFRYGYQNPTRPPNWFMNFWTVRHSQSDFVVSSAAINGWEVISKLRYIRAELRTEVLKPWDPAEIHFEFVTVNPADELRIVAVGPPSFSFANAFVSSTPGEVAEEGEFWRGFTDVSVGSQSESEIRIKFEVNAVEYVRFRLGGVLIPFIGGQALFDFFTTIRGMPQDEQQGCCPPNFPPDNPGYVFRVPHRFYNFYGSLSNEFMQDPIKYPIASGMENRLGEDHRTQFIFYLPAGYVSMRPRQNYEIVIVVRPPMGYIFVPENKFEIKTVSKNAAPTIAEEEEGEEAPSDLALYTLRNNIRQLTEDRAELSLVGTYEVFPDVEYRITFDATTPSLHAERLDRRMWVFGITDRFALENNVAADILGVYDDFVLMAQTNFSVFAPVSPPEVVISVHVELLELGELFPNRVDVYAPTGYKFVLNCFAPGQDDVLEPFFVSCRERWSIFSGNYLSGANMMAVDGGVNSSMLPVVVKLLAQTPAQTPATNTWYIRAYNYDGLTSWGLNEGAFPVNPMDVDIAYAATANSRVPIFLTMRLRTALPFDGHVHMAAPRLYQLHCPVRKVLRGPMMPLCTQDDPVLTGCWGLPSPQDPDPAPGLPLCDPLHELLLTFPREEGGSDEGIYVMKKGDDLFLALEVTVPSDTPYPHSVNVFRVRLLDESKANLDGKLNELGGEVISLPRLQDFRLWWQNAEPDSVAQIALEFSFNATMPRNQEDPERRLRVIQIDAPPGLRMAVRRPTDVIPLDPDSRLIITEWNWTGLLPRGLWFGIDTEQNVTGKFHFAFPVALPSQAEGMPFNNLWRIKLCADSPMCIEELLSVPLPGFFFGEDPGYELSQSAFDALMGGDAWRRAGAAAPLLIALAVAVAVAASSAAGWSDG